MIYSRLNNSLLVGDESTVKVDRTEPSNEVDQEFITKTKVITETEMDFVTIANNISENNYIIADLKPGGRYQCRVR